MHEWPQRRHLHEPRVLLLPLLCRHPVQISVEVEVLQDTQILIQPELLRHVADAALDLLRVSGDVEAQDLQDASVSHHQPGGQTDERGLAGPVRSDQGCEHPVADVEGDTVERLDDITCVAAERLTDVAATEDRCVLSRRTHRCPSAVGPVGAWEPWWSSARETVAGMPRRKASPGSFTNTRTS